MTERASKKSNTIGKRPVLLALCTLLTLISVSHGQQVLTAELRTPSVGRTLKYHVALPAGYDASTDRYAVLYMLHGFSSNYTQSFRFAAAEAAKNRPLILVMPDGGNSWWINWAGSQPDQKNAWEDYLTKDLIAHVDATYRTIAERRGRALCGLSMGGFGAITVGLRHPEIYCSIGSTSGALLYARQSAEHVARGESLLPKMPPSSELSAQVTTAGFSSQAERTPRGVPFVTVEDCARYDPFQLVLTVGRRQATAHRSRLRDRRPVSPRHARVSRRATDERHSLHLLAVPRRPPRQLLAARSRPGDCRSGADSPAQSHGARERQGDGALAATTR